MNFSLAIETSTRNGSISLGRADDLLATVRLRRPRRHNLDLMPSIARTCHEHGCAGRAIEQIYVSVGPGSFTGLRIAVATAKMLAIAGTAKIVAVPTADAVAANAPPDAPYVAVCLDRKHDRFHAAVYERTEGGGLRTSVEPRQMTADELWAAAPAPLLVIAEEAALDAALPDHARRLADAAAVPKSEAVWHLGRTSARAGRFIDPMALVPTYSRPPEAVTLWNKRKATGR